MVTTNSVIEFDRVDGDYIDTAACAYPGCTWYMRETRYFQQSGYDVEVAVRLAADEHAARHQPAAFVNFTGKRIVLRVDGLDIDIPPSDTEICVPRALVAEKRIPVSSTKYIPVSANFVDARALNHGSFSIREERTNIPPLVPGVFLIVPQDLLLSLNSVGLGRVDMVFPTLPVVQNGTVVAYQGLESLMQVRIESE